MNYASISCLSSLPHYIHSVLCCFSAVYNNRQMNAELAQNPLRHYDIASNSNESDLNVEQIAGIEKEME